MSTANLSVSLGGIDISLSVVVQEDGRKTIHIAVSDPAVEVLTSPSNFSTPLPGLFSEADSTLAAPAPSLDSAVLPSAGPLPPSVDSPELEPPAIVLDLAARLSTGVGDSPRSRIVACWHLGRDDALSATAAREGHHRPLRPALAGRLGAKYTYFVIYSGTGGTGHTRSERALADLLLGPDGRPNPLAFYRRIPTVAEGIAYWHGAGLGFQRW